MNDVKLRVSLLVPGARMLTRKECRKNPKESYNEEILKVSYKDKGKVKKETLHVKTRKNITVRQNINICESAYRYMLTDDAPPAPKYAKIVRKSGKKAVRLWDTMSSKERLNAHMELLAQHFNAVDFSYEILH